MSSAGYAHYEQHRYHFEKKVAEAIDVAKQVLGDTKNPVVAEDADHKYEDKFGLAECLTNTAIAAVLNALERIGLDGEKLQQLVNLSDGGKRAVTLRLNVNKSCKFIKKKIVEETPARSHEHVLEVTETKEDHSTGKKTFSSKVVTKVTEHHWKVRASYDMFAFVGLDPKKDRVDIMMETASSCTMITLGEKRPPRPFSNPAKEDSATEHTTSEQGIDAPIGWLLKYLMKRGEGDFLCDFAVDRTDPKCRTPLRNDNIKEALDFFHQLAVGCNQVRFCFDNVAEIGSDVEGLTRFDLSDINRGAQGVFVPVIPMFDESGDASTETVEKQMQNDGVDSCTSPSINLPDTLGDGMPLLRGSDTNMLLQEQCRSLDERIESLKSSFSESTNPRTLYGFYEASTSTVLSHVVEVQKAYLNGISYIEGMLHNQLVAAIGKRLRPSDFTEYMGFHHKKLFRPEYAPSSFCYTIRRPEHYPDGTISITRADGHENESKAIETITRLVDQEVPMEFAINAATSVEFTGKRYLHAWVTHDFDDGSCARRNQNGKINLVARARQFSSFLLLIGKISGPDKFDPQHAIILQNKDEVIVPLLLEQLPTPKEFKDAIQSLSPEQQRFAKAFRSMQLESSVFAICIIQLKPQLETLLGLPSNSLTKEIGLTQDLLELFIKYQIPSDLLTYDGDVDASPVTKVATVKGHVKSVQEIVEGSKEKQLESATQEADMRFEQLPAQLPPPPDGRGPVNSRSGAYAAVGRFSSIQGEQPTCSPMMQKQQMRRGRRCFAAGSSLGAAVPPDGFVSGAVSNIGTGFDRDAPPHVAYGPVVLDVASGAGAKTCSAPLDATTRPSLMAPRSKGQSQGDQATNETLDFTMIPQQLDAKFDRLDEDSALRPTVIKAGGRWKKKFQKTLLSPMETKAMNEEDLRTEKNRAFDLLDALSRSGSLSIRCAELHVMVAATHCFDRSLVDTVIQDNINPIERYERSLLIVSSTIHDMAPVSLLKDEGQVQRLGQFSPLLLENGLHGQGGAEDATDEDPMDVLES